MADISIGAAVGSGFHLIRRKPLTVLTWGLLQVVALAPFALAYASMMSTVLSTAMSHAGSDAQPSQAEVTAMLGGMLMSEGLFFLGAIILVCFRAVLCAAIWRSVIHPEQSRWAYLRVGKAELFILLMLFAVGLIANFAILPLAPLLVIAGALMAMHQWVAAIAVGVISFIALIVALIYLELRFSLLGPMIVADGNLHFADAWRLTKGQVGRLFLVGLCLGALIWLAEIVIFAIVGGIAVAGLGLASGGLEHLQAMAMQSPGSLVTALAPALIVCAILAIPLAGAL